MKKVKYFRYWRVGHHKWECPNIERQKGRSEQTVHVVGPQKAQQERRLACPI